MAVGLSLTAVAVACSDPLAPGDVTGTYVLVTVGGRPVPVSDDGINVVIADTTVYRADGTWTIVDVDSLVGVAQSRRVSSGSGTWTLDAVHAALLRISPGNGTAQNPPLTTTYRVSDGGRTLTFATSRGDWVFRRTL